MSDAGRPLTNHSYSDVMRRATGTHEEEESRRPRNRKGGLRLPGCCFLAPAGRAPGRERSAMDDSGRSSRQRHPERTEQPPPPTEASSRIQSTCSISDSNGSSSCSRGAEQPRSETTRTPTKPSKTTTGAGGGVGAFGPVVGLSVVVAVSMAGLLGGRFCAVACLCAWLAALSKLRRREAAATTTTGSEVVAVDVDSTDHKEPVVLRGLLERDRRKAVAAA